MTTVSNVPTAAAALAGRKIARRSFAKAAEQPAAPAQPMPAAKVVAPQAEVAAAPAEERAARRAPRAEATTKRAKKANGALPKAVLTADEVKKLAEVARGAESVVAPKVTMPVLENAHIEFFPGLIAITAMNLTKSITVTRYVTADTQGQGAITIHAKRLAGVMKNLPAGNGMTLTIDAARDTLRVECGAFNGSLRGMDAELFPGVPSVEGEPLAVLNAKQLEQAIQVATGAAVEGETPLGFDTDNVQLLLRGQEAILYAGNQFRTSRASVQLARPVSEQKAYVIPSESAAPVAKLLAGEMIEVHQITGPDGAASLLAFVNDEVKIITRLVGDRFANIDGVYARLPEPTMRATVKGAELMRWLRLASLFAVDTNNPLILSFGREGIAADTGATQVGEQSGQLEADVTGELRIKVNVKMVIEQLAPIASGKVIIEGSDSKSMLRLLAAEGATSINQLVMPLALA